LRVSLGFVTSELSALTSAFHPLWTLALPVNLHPAMMFAKHLRKGIREGQITTTIRIWKRPRVKLGGVYPMEDGHVMVESIREIAIGDITGEMARRSGFRGVVDLLKVAKHGSGTSVYLIDFEYLPRS
jgi:hypothetical protein